jgi:hypothetical protein
MFINYEWFGWYTVEPTTPVQPKKEIEDISET